MPYKVKVKGKGKAIQVQAWINPIGIQEDELSRISRKSTHEDDKVVSPTHRPY
jgi:hypothetical protein